MLQKRILGQAEHDHNAHLLNLKFEKFLPGSTTMNKLIALICSILTLFRLNAIVEVPYTIFPTVKTYPTSTTIGFEIINKSDSPVVLTLFNKVITDFETKQSQTVKKEFLLQKNETKMFRIDIYGTTALHVGRAFVTDKAMIDLNYVFTFTPNKTIYLTLRPNFHPTPETGVKKGWGGVTNTNLNLENNVKQEDIIKVVSKK
jgi:hypothetical protein